MKIQQLSNLSGRAANMLFNVTQLHPLFDAAEFRYDPSYFPNVPDKSTFSSSAARAENAAPVKDSAVPNPTGVNQASYTREVGIDNKRRLDYKSDSAGLANYGDRQLINLFQYIAGEVQDDMTGGTGASYHMLGLSSFIKDAAYGGQTAALGFTQAEQAAMNTQVALKIDSATTQAEFLELLDKEILNVPGANAIIVNRQTKARLTTVARKLSLLDQTLNYLGVPVPSYNGIPIIGVPSTAIPQTESDGSNSDCTSLYIVRFAESQGVCFATNSGFAFQDFPDYQSTSELVARLEINLNLVVERTDAVKRLSRIRL